MGRMADARKRARRGDTAAGPPPEPNHDEAASRPEPVLADETVEPEVAPADAARAGGRVELPASGLAEDILRQLEAEPPDRSVPGTPASPGRVELPASGLAEDVLVREEVAGAHSLSFFAAPVQDRRAAAEATEHLATFFLDREEYGVDVRQVQEIRRTTEITSVGEVEDGRATRIVVVRVKERLLGLLVDGASQVLKVEVSRIEPAPEEVVEKGGDYIRGVAKLDDRLIILVDLERLLVHELRAAGASAAGVRATEGTDGVS